MSKHKKSKRPVIKLERDLEEGEFDIDPNFHLFKSGSTRSKLCSVLEIQSHGKQVCAISSDSKYAALIVHNQQTTSRNSGAKLWLFDFQKSKYCLLDTLKDSHNHCLSFHSTQSLLSVTLPNATVQLYNTETRTIGDRIDFSLLNESLVGVRWCGDKLLCYSSSCVILYSSPNTNNLKLQGNIVWVSAVESDLVVVCADASLQIWDISSGSLVRTVMCPQELHPETDIQFAALVGNYGVLLGGKSAHLLRFSLSSHQWSQLSLPSSSQYASSVCCVSTDRNDYPQVVLLSDDSGALHVYCPQQWKRLKTLQCDHLKIVNICTSNEWVLISYSSGCTKVYPLHSLLPEETVDCADGKRFLSLQSTIDKVATVLDEKQRAHKVKETVTSADWLSLLKDWGSYPSDQRLAIWTGVLQLPRNKDIFRALRDKAIHHRVRDYTTMEDGALRGTFRLILSCLFHCAPPLSLVEWVPDFVFPFVKFAQQSPLVCFEICLTLLVSWCSFLFHPEGSPCPALAPIELLVADCSPRLMSRLVMSGVSAEVFALPLLTSAMANILSPTDWLVVWDHIVSHPPSYFLCITAAYTICNSSTICSAGSAREIEVLFRQESFLPLSSLLQKADSLHREARLDSHTRELLSTVREFPRGGLPVFDHLYDEQVTSVPSEGSHWQLDEEEFHSIKSELRKKQQKCKEEITKMRQKHLNMP